MIEFRQVSFAYAATEPILKQISFKIEPGEFVALAGRNGSGKTTLTRLIMALRKPSAGAILVNEAVAAKFKPADMARTVSYVFQNPDRQLFKNTVLEEVAYGPEQLGLSATQALKQAQEVLEQTDLRKWAQAHPASLPRSLKQKTAIASALAMKPKLLILDEPTSGQDAWESASLLKLLTQCNSTGMALLLVTHDMDLLAQYAKRVLVLHQGDLVFDGSPAALFSQNEVTKWGLAEPVCVKLSKALFPQTPPALSVAELQQRLSGQLRRIKHA